MSNGNEQSPRRRLLGAIAEIRLNAEVIEETGDLGEFEEALSAIERAASELRLL